LRSSADTPVAVLSSPMVGLLARRGINRWPYSGLPPELLKSAVVNAGGRIGAAAGVEKKAHCRRMAVVGVLPKVLLQRARALQPLC